MLADLYPSTASSSPYQLTAFKDWLYFSAFGPDSGRELWRTDGTLAGTTMFDLNPGTSDALSTLVDLVVAGDNLFIAARDSVGLGLWKTDGSGAPTLVQRAGGGSFGIDSLMAVGSQVYFRGYDSSNGYELWTSDGTTLGTGLVKDIFPGAGSSYPQDLTALNGQLYFTVDSRLWRSDGTSTGTVPVMTSPELAVLSVHEVVTLEGRRLLPGWQLLELDLALAHRRHRCRNRAGLRRRALWHLQRSNLTAIAGRLHFFAKPNSELTLWVSDGTTDGTQFVHGFNVDVRAADMTEHNGDAYFVISGPFTQPTLWKSNGSTEGTLQVLADIGPRNWAPDDL